MINSKANYETILENENSIKKLLLHPEKCAAIMDVIEQKQDVDFLPPICIELHLTNICNLNCTWCIDKKIREKSLQEIPFENVIKLLDILENTKVGITIEGGGEPTMYSKFNEFITECYKRNIQIGLITNGTNRINKELLKCFTFIRVSLDAATPEEYVTEKGKDCFKNVIENIRYIKENSESVVLGVSYVLNNRNYSNMKNLFEIFEGIGINYFRIRHIEENANLAISMETLERIEREINQYSEQTKINVSFSKNINFGQTNNNNLPCIAHSLRALILATGDVCVCAKRRHDPLVIGNINSDNFFSIWNSEERRQATKKLMLKENQIGCTICRITKYNEIFCSMADVKTSRFI